MSTFILQDRTKALILSTTLTSATPIPNFTLRILDSTNSSVFATIPVVNPSGTETFLNVATYISQDSVTSDGESVWYDQEVEVDASSVPGGVSYGFFVEVNSLFDAFGATCGSWGLYPDVDTHSVWVANNAFTGASLQKYDLDTYALTDSWQIPFTSYGPSYINGTTFFAQDTTGNLYVMSGDNFTGYGNHRLHKIDPSTKLELGALGYDQVHTYTSGDANVIWGPIDWSVWSYAGADYISFASNNDFIHVINLNTMTLLGSYNLYNFDSAIQGVFGTWQDKFGNIWWACLHTDQAIHLFKWVPSSGTSGTVGGGNVDPQLVITNPFNVPLANWSTGFTGGGYLYTRYVPEIHAFIVADSNETGDEFWGTTLALIDLTDGHQVAIIPSSTVPAISMDGGDLSCIAGLFRDNKVPGLSGNTFFATEGDVTDTDLPHRRGGVLSLIDPTTLIVSQQVDFTLDTINTVTTQETGGGYTFQGVWSSATIYMVGDIVTGSDGAKYLALTTSGPGDPMGLGPLDPTNISANWENWVGLPDFDNTRGDVRSPIYAHCAGMLYNETVGVLVSTRQYNGSTVMVTNLSSGNGPFLSDLTRDVCLRAGLTVDQIDVTQISNILINGYLLTNQTDAKSALQNPFAAYFVDAVESDFKLKFVPRGANASVLQIPESDLGLVADKAELQETYVQQADLPKSVSVTFIDPTIDWQQNTALKARSARAVKTKSTATLALPMVLTPVEARAIAEKSLYLAYYERRPYDFNLWKMAYAVLDPTDVVQFVYEGKVYQMRIVNTSLGVNYSLTLSGVSEDLNAYTSVTVAGIAAGVPSESGVPVLPTVLAMLDVPYLEDSDASADRSQTGFYWWSSSGKGWPGDVLYKSDDDITFDSIDSTVVRTVYGNILGTLGDPPVLWSWDTINTLTVQLADTTASLSGTTDLAVLNGANPLFVGGELIQYVNAVQNMDGTFTLSRLLRGRRNTEYAAYGHAADELIFDPTTGIKHDAAPLAIIGLLRYYRGVTIGQTVTSAPDYDFTINANDLKPAMPVHITGTRDMSGNLTIDWFRRTRYNGDWLNNAGNVPLNEDSEAYSIDIYGLRGSPAVETVVRTINWTPGTYDVNGNPEATYSAADQTTDFGSPQSSVLVYIYQISGEVGRGFPGKATI